MEVFEVAVFFRKTVESTSTQAHEVIRRVCDGLGHYQWTEGHGSWEGNERVALMGACDRVACARPIERLPLMECGPALQEALGAKRRRIPRSHFLVEWWVGKGGKNFLIHPAGSEVVSARWDRGTMVPPGGQVAVLLEGGAKGIVRNAGGHPVFCEEEREETPAAALREHEKRRLLSLGLSAELAEGLLEEAGVGLSVPAALLAQQVWRARMTVRDLKHLAALSASGLGAQQAVSALAERRLRVDVAPHAIARTLRAAAFALERMET